MATCSYTSDFDGYPCPLQAEEGATLCILHSPDPGKDSLKFLEALRDRIRRDNENGETDTIRLNGVVFPGPLVWSKVVGGLPKIAKPINFSEATFTRDAYFIGATFTGNAHFIGATFTRDAHFSQATFTGDADFSQATFTGDAYFWWATFTRDAHFSEATFTGNANFSWATFTGNAYFSQATFTGNAYFWWATFSGRTFFQHSAFPTEEAKGTISFQETAIEKPEEFFLEDVDLSHTSFLRTNLTKVQFTDITWAKKSERFLPKWAHNVLAYVFRRLPAKVQRVRRYLPRVEHNVLYDHLEMEHEEKNRKEEGKSQGENEGSAPGAGEEGQPDQQQRKIQNKARLVANLYRQLRLNYEGSKQEVEAGHFYIGQMDMRQRDPETGWFTRRLALPLYRAVAMYGESAWRPLLLYLLTSFLFAALYLYAGFYWSGEEPRKAVDYGWRWGGAFLPFSGDFLKAWYLSLTAGSLLRGNVQVMADWGLIVAYANMVWDIFLIALFVIALRRHFRR